jgi:hypothetical protein
MTSAQWKFEQLLEKFDKNAPASISDIRQFEMTLGRPLSADYTAFLLYANGGEGWVGDNGYISLWPLEEILEANKSCGFDEFAPHLLAFGSDGGGEAFAFNMRVNEMPVVMVDYIAIEDERPMASNFYSFLVVWSKWDFSGP